MMKFRELLAVLGIASNDDRMVHEITTDHRKAREGVLFIACKGHRFDANQMVGEALAKGAMVIANVKQEGVITVDDSFTALALVSEAFYGYPHRYLTMIGITGTSGKSSVSHYIAQLLRNSHRRVCVIGSDGIFLEDMFYPTENTTPSALELSRVLQECVANRIEFVVMEVSSHALWQGRVTGLRFDVVLYLNLGHDHLDYHPSWYQYRESKAKLLDLLKDHGKIVINGDDKELLSLLEEARHPLTMYGEQQGQYQISDITLTATSSSFALIDKSSQRTFDVAVNLLGKSNVYNVTAALLGCQAAGVSLDDAVKETGKLTPLSGRMEVVYQGEFVVMVDYAHTVDAFVQLGEFVAALPAKRRVIVMGLGGNRDKSKRPLIGDVLHQYFDVLILTSDNPRHEDPLDIIADVCANCGYDKVKIETDRERAIQLAIQEALDGDIIVAAGKGNEQFQQIGDVRLPFVDKDVIARALAKRIQ